MGGSASLPTVQARLDPDTVGCYGCQMRTKTVIDYYGSKSAVARALGIKRQSVIDWGATVPDLRQYQVQLFTNGAIMADKRLQPK